MKLLHFILLGMLPSIHAFAGATPYLVQVEVGDESCDGHCINKSQLYLVSVSRDQLKTLDQALTSQLGFNYRQSVLNEYADVSLKPKQQRKIRDILGDETFVRTLLATDATPEHEGAIDPQNPPIAQLAKSSWSLTESSYLILYWALLNKIEPTFVSSTVNLPYQQPLTLSGIYTVHLGGYGLFGE